MTLDSNHFPLATYLLIIGTQVLLICMKSIISCFIKIEIFQRFIEDSAQFIMICHFVIAIAVICCWSRSHPLPKDIKSL